MLLPAGSEADFSSSSSTGSLKTRGNLSSAAKKAPSRRYDVHICGLLGSDCNSLFSKSRVNVEDGGTLDSQRAYVVSLQLRVKYKMRDASWRYILRQ